MIMNHNENKNKRIRIKRIKRILELIRIRRRINAGNNAGLYNDGDGDE